MCPARTFPFRPDGGSAPTATRTSQPPRTGERPSRRQDEEERPRQVYSDNCSDFPDRIQGVTVDARFEPGDGRWNGPAHRLICFAVLGKNAKKTRYRRRNRAREWLAHALDTAGEWPPAVDQREPGQDGHPRGSRSVAMDHDPRQCGRRPWARRRQPAGPGGRRAGQDEDPPPGRPPGMALVRRRGFRNPETGRLGGVLGPGRVGRPGRKLISTSADAHHCFDF